MNNILEMGRVLFSPPQKKNNMCHEPILFTS
jgi:hypothetical protein